MFVIGESGKLKVKKSYWKLKEKNVKVYRIKHIPTGLYYRPARQIQLPLPDRKWGFPSKSNLSKDGKIYTKRPPIEKWLKNGIWNHKNVRLIEHWPGKSMRPASTKEPFDPNDWEIEESEI